MTRPGRFDVYHAIADPRRRGILELLSEAERPVREIVGRFDVSFAAISQHLKVLHAAGLVSRRAAGRARLYRLTPAALEEVYDWTARYRAFWTRRIKKLND